MLKILKSIGSDIGAALLLILPGLLSAVFALGALHGVYIMFTIHAPLLTKMSILVSVGCLYFLIYYCVVGGYKDFLSGKGK
jgi:D-alanyl-lipoteichoic acid acyltransferase DltB (MBOAT superfamily)